MQPMDALPGVQFVQGDFREAAVFEHVVALFPGREVDVVLSDMAPDLSGVDAIDQPRSMDLAELGLGFAERVLKRDGSALIKVFQGAGLQEFLGAARRKFGAVKLCKPEASRARSPELYLLAKGFRLV
jgi:23S rRNA (uridine2552-2'-O)-methyltransferase